MAFLKAVLIILLVYYLIKILAKMFAPPKIFGYAARKTQEHFKEKFEEFSQQQRPSEERVGDVIIDKNATKTRKPSKPVGDYIDFEEVD